MATIPTVVSESFAGVGLQVVACEVVRDFPWSYVLRLTTSDGDTVWAKRCGDGMAFEPGLTRIIEDVGSPALVPTLWMSGRWIATEHVDGQLERGDERTRLAVLELQAPLASLQRGLTSRVEEMRLAGTPTLGSADAQALVDRAVRLCATYRHLAERPLTSADEQQLQRAVPRLVAALEQLEEIASPTTLLHLDLHHGNVFERDGRAQLFDWGDARIGSALLHAVSTLSLLGFIMQLDTRDPRIVEVANAYLSEWPSLRLDDEVRDLLHDPRLAALVRIDALAAALSGGSDAAVAPFADWLPDLVRAAGAADPAAARGVRLA